MFQRLMTENCSDETQKAVCDEGANKAIQTSFGLLGQIAMKELMNHSLVNAGFDRFGQYVNTEELKVLGLE